MRLLLKNGYIIDPASGREGLADILIDEGKIIALSEGLEDRTARAVPLGGKIVVPGLIDMHVHLREPGGEEKETIETGLKSAVVGGFTSVASMPNTKPVIDKPELVKSLLEKAQKMNLAHLYPIASITVGQLGKELTNFPALKASGVVALSDDGKSIESDELMAFALIRAKPAGLPLIAHCEDSTLASGWVMNEGEVSKKLKVKGVPKEAEERMVERDILLAERTEGRVHIAHVSTAGSVALIREAKARGVKVTAEATPHHFTLTEEAVLKCQANAKMNPPLRTTADVAAVREGLKDGTIDVIATDHAPHTVLEKAWGLEKAPFGVIGLETALPLVITELVKGGLLTMKEAIAKLSINPANILGINKGRLAVGMDADITVIDPDQEIEINAENFFSKGRNTPFEGWKLKGIAFMTIVSGRVVAGKGRLIR